MREKDLRRVLLIEAIEETDRAGTLLPPADRIAASREARRGAGEGAPAVDGDKDGALSETGQQLLAARARILFGKTVARHPFIETVLNLAGGPPGAGWALIALALVLGGSLSALDGTRRINILSFPLLGLVLWNVFVYVIVVIGWVRSERKTDSQPRRLIQLWVRLGMGRLSRLIAGSGAFNALLAEALSRFAITWHAAAKTLLVARATRVFHLCAAAIGIGLIAGLYLRGIAFDYQAGWESTFLDATGVRSLLGAVYGPAVFVTGLPIPDAAHLDAIRWRNGAGGERATVWIHLLAASVALLVVIPRVLLALVSTVYISRWSQRARLPASLAACFRNAFGAVGGVTGRAVATVIPCAYEPSADSRSGLRALLPAALGESLSVDSRAPVRYGDEDEVVQSLGLDKSDVVVLLFNLASTPEDENHGSVIEGVRDGLAAAQPRARLLVFVDEAPYVSRMTNDGGPAARVEERRRAWRDFVAARGLIACIENLAAAGREAPLPAAQIDGVRNALWVPATP